MKLFYAFFNSSIKKNHLVKGGLVRIYNVADYFLSKSLISANNSS